MGFKNTIEIITKDIQELEKMVRNFENNSPIPSIDLDLALDKTRNLYELLLMIREYESESEQEKQEAVKNLSSPTNTEERKRSKATDENTPGPGSSSTTPPQEIEFTDPEPEKSTARENSDNQPSVEPEDSSGKMQNENMDKILAEKFQRKTDFINEKIGGDKPGRDLSSRMQSSPIKSISGSLGINDKFYFIRELFGGDAENFRQTLKTLDEASTYQEAYNYLQNSFDWDMESETVKQLLTLIHRKFISTGNE